MTSHAIAPGATVQEKSKAGEPGSRRMTVTGVYERMDGTHVASCTWYVGGALKADTFPLDALKVAK